MDNNNSQKQNNGPGRAASAKVDPVTLPDLLDPPHVRAGLNLVGQAVRNQWDIPESVYKQLGARINRILKTGTPREKLAAAKVLLAMSAANDRPLIQQHQHVHAVIPSSNLSSLNAKREEAARLLALLR